MPTARPKTNRAARPIQNTDTTTTVDIYGQERMYTYADIANFILAEMSESEAFTNQTSITITHGLGRKPIVWVTDSNNKRFNTGVTYTGNTSFTVGTFTSARSGIVHWL